ncbi:protein Gawky isoform X1 [Diabrotica virgifera virgifera]|uniref:UBA domain-containing protein n=1 Tax=Diabrotica virgifera virgifera TaxID=50390 RepID=A0ABM5JXX5_DIAVI|nr:protein Gawky isoform X1 [Diabrotica virgifera virgifera]XP_050502790.1 protein Gawky isoform X1 [Diabrotica virgifera virgifera]
MRAPTPSEPKSTFPTYQVPQKSAMRGSAPPVQVAGPSWGGRADPPSSTRCADEGALSVISGSSCRSIDNSNIRMQSVTENCLLNSVTVPNMQRLDHGMVTHNNSFKLVSKFGALLPGRDIPNQKSDDLELLRDDLNVLNSTKYDTKTLCDNNDEKDDHDAYQMSNIETHTCTNNDNSYQELYKPLRLRGGGESSLSTGTSGWGTPPSQSGNNNANKSNGQQPPTSQSNNTGWGQPGTKTANNNAMPPNSQPPTSTANSQNNNGPSNNTKQQLEQLNSMREAIFSQDGWGGQHVNQDTNWDIPSSPEPPIKMDGSGGPPPWKPAVNNGTELWEANLRNGGQPPPQPQQKTPWGHTPSTNIGGTWGEDDDADTSNVWTGVPSNQPQWGGAGGNTNNGAMWGGPKKENDWGTGASNTGGWGDPRAADPRQTGMDPREIRPELRDMRAGNTETMRIMDPRETMRQMSNSDMRGDPRGITGRLNGAGAEAFWGQGTPHAASQPIHHHNKMPVPPGNGTGGWEEPSPPSQRRNMPNYDDGTSLWGNPQQGSHWKDLPTGGSMGRGGNPAGPPGMNQARGMKQPEGSMWGGHGRNGSWDETGPGAAWDEPNSWAKQKMPDPLWDESEWGHKQQSKPQLTKEMVWNSKQFRMLVDMGHKKEDVENALRLRAMNVEEALDLLSPMRNNRANDGWNTRHDDHYEHPPFCQRGFSTGPGGQLTGFQPGNNAPNLLNNMSNPGTNNSLINNIAPAVVQKLLTQQQGGGSQGFGGSSANAGRNIQPQSQPSTQQLRMLVQQIQMAVQAGYLNHQILNQPLAPQTLVLLNQLLQQIKNLQQLISQQSITGTPINGKQNNAYMQFSVLITKTKQSIANLQNQIAAQQATYVKQQQHQSSMGAYDSFKTNPMHDSINALQTNFGDLGINKEPQMNPQQSRLTQWISKDKDDGGEFSRAPGSSSKPPNTSPNMNPLVLNPSDGPWSTGRTGDTGWPDSSANDNSNDVKDAQWSTTTQPSLTDLVPEFEPGKPWKGNQIKIEDDPSITPGSVVRSPLSIATIKDNELFNMNPSKSPPATDGIQSLSLSSSTWSFNPSGTSTSSAFTSPPGKLPTSKALGDLNPSTAVTSELWGAPKSSRGPPPGLSAKGSGAISNGWSAVNTMPWGPGGQRTSGNWGGSSQWLLLRNLTAQIDGSTLRTLCLQHGPLLSFHLYLHQGFALAKYSSREEAIKAQTTLNNCVLGNTTILAENPTDWDANTLLQQVASQQSGSSGAWRGSSKQPTGADTWSTGWPNNSSSTSLWAAPQLDNSDPARGTPSSLNSFLPNDLLGGESM